MLIFLYMPIVEHEFENRSDFLQYLSSNNKHGVILKFTADWCQPCQKIKPFVDNLVQNLKDDIIYINVDVDENFDLYANLKRLKQVQGIPTILYYKPGNTNFIPDKNISGTDEKQLTEFFSTFLK